MRLYLSIFILLFFGSKSYSQVELSETDKLVQLAKVWGFLKYYHPHVSKGKFDWDKELIQIIPKIEKAKSKDQISSAYNEWIATLGNVKNCRKCKNQKIETFDKNFNLNWISDTSDFNNELTNALLQIESNRRLGKKYYVEYANKKPSQAQMVNEEIYDMETWNDSKIRLVTLFRYWNFVEYFFPYKYQTDKSWDKVLEYFIPIFLNAETETEFHLALLELVASINDSHGVFITEQTFEYFGNKFLPVKIKYIDGVGVVTGFYDDSLAYIDDFKVGDIITQIGGLDISTKYENLKKYITGSNEEKKKSNASKYLFNGVTDTVEIEFKRNGQLYSKVVLRYLYKDFNIIKNSKKSYEVLSNNVGYINMGWLERENVHQVFNELYSTKGLILDFRSYPNSTWDLIIDHVSSTEKEFCTIIYPLLDYPGKYIVNEPFKCGANSPKKYKGKVVLLVSEDTQSHAEYSVMSLQTGDNVVTVGSRTSGADGNTTTFRMFNNYKTMITGTGVFYPDMTVTQREGIKIDYEVNPTIKGISENKDELLMKAIELILN